MSSIQKLKLNTLTQEKIMFNTFAHAAVDAIQTSKKQFVETFVKHEGIATALNSFVDSQTKYTKSAIDAGIATATSLGAILASKSFFDEMTENAKSLVPAFVKGK